MTAAPTSTEAVRLAAGTRRLTTALIVVGVVNYVYSVALTRMLELDAYTVFVAGQSLLLTASTVASVCVPWALAQSLVMARDEDERTRALTFATTTGVLVGAVAALAVAVAASRFAAWPTTTVVALSTFLVFVAGRTRGWLQGEQRIARLAVLTVGEVIVKVVVGLLLVLAAGLGATGALAGAAVGALIVVLAGPRRRGTARHPWWRVLSESVLWRRMVGIATIQLLVALLVSIDVVLMTQLPAPAEAAASYQASVVVSRIPLFLASGVSVAYFPALSKAWRPDLAAAGMRLYLQLALPLAAVLATVPAEVVGVVFPSEYALVGTLLRVTAITGLIVGTVNLLTTYLQARNDWSVIPVQALGVVLYTALLLAGWAIGGTVGLALGSALGTATLLGGLLVHLSRRRMPLPAGTSPFFEPALLALVLLLVRPVPGLWLVVSAIAGTRVSLQYLHRTRSSPGDRTRGSPDEDGGALDGARLLVDVVWRGTEPRDPDDSTLEHALRLAYANDVQGRFARAFPERLGEVCQETAARSAAFRDNLQAAAGRLATRGIRPVLIKADPDGDCVYPNFDLVVPRGQWPAAVRALEDWAARRERYWLERSTKELFWPAAGPGAHLHSAVTWFGIDVIAAEGLLQRSHARSGGPWAIPGPPDQLRIWLAHALFQNLSFDLSELLAVRPLLRDELVATARLHAHEEGWSRSFDAAVELLRTSMGKLDRGEAVLLPLPLPVGLSLGVAVEHAWHTVRSGHLASSVREIALRPPLVAAKRGPWRGGP